MTIATLRIESIRAPEGPGTGDGACRAASRAGIALSAGPPDAILVFIRGETRTPIVPKGRPLLVVALDEWSVRTPLLMPRNVAAWLVGCGARVVGVEGPTEEQEPGIGRFVEHYLADLVHCANDTLPPPEGEATRKPIRAASYTPRPHGEFEW